MPTKSEMRPTGPLFHKGDVVVGAWEDGTEHTAEVLEIADGDANAVYLHYPGHNRRMDDWVDPSSVVRMATSAEQATLSAARREKQTRQTRTSSRRREAAEGQTLLSLPGVDMAAAAAAEAEHAAVTRVKNVSSLTLGAWSVRCWYFSPFPEGFQRLRALHVHPMTLRYFASRTALLRHHATQGAGWAAPPGREVLSDARPAQAWALADRRATAKGRPAAWPARLPRPEPCAASGRRLARLSVFEVDGARHRLWCRSLCLLAKLFLDHKTLYFDVDPFLFYVLCEVDDAGVAHIVGYFSKEKHCPEGNNLACILTLPPYQGRGYAKTLMALSFALSRAQRTRGCPERPLSDLGRVSYSGFWSWAVLRALAGLAGITDRDAEKAAGSPAAPKRRGAAPAGGILVPAFKRLPPSEAVEPPAMTAARLHASRAASTPRTGGDSSPSPASSPPRPPASRRTPASSPAPGPMPAAAPAGRAAAPTPAGRKPGRAPAAPRAAAAASTPSARSPPTSGKRGRPPAACGPFTDPSASGGVIPGPALPPSSPSGAATAAALRAASTSASAASAVIPADVVAAVARGGLTADGKAVAQYVSAVTGVTFPDVLSTMEALGAVRYRAGCYSTCIGRDRILALLAAKWRRYRHREVEARWLRPSRQLPAQSTAQAARARRTGAADSADVITPPASPVYGAGRKAACAPAGIARTRDESDSGGAVGSKDASSESDEEEEEEASEEEEAAQSGGEDEESDDEDDEEAAFEESDESCSGSESTAPSPPRTRARKRPREAVACGPSSTDEASAAESGTESAGWKSDEGSLSALSDEEEEEEEEEEDADDDSTEVPPRTRARLAHGRRRAWPVRPTPATRSSVKAAPRGKRGPAAVKAGGRRKQKPPPAGQRTLLELLGTMPPRRRAAVQATSRLRTQR